MENTKKLLLVPEDMMSGLRNRTNESETRKQVNRLDQEMHHILESELSEDIKWKMYNEILQRFLTMKDQDRKNIPTVNFKQETTKSQPADGAAAGKAGNSETAPEAVADPGRAAAAAGPGIARDPQPDRLTMRILDNVPKQMEKKTASLLEFMQSHPDIVRFDDKNQLVYQGRTVNGSNAIDLVNNLMVAKKHFAPKGIDQLLTGLSQINIPESYLGNRARLYQLQQINQPHLSLPSPPSTPSSRGRRRKPKTTPSLNKSQLENSLYSERIQPVQTGEGSTKNRRHRLNSAHKKAVFRWQPY